MGSRPIGMLNHQCTVHSAKALSFRLLYNGIVKPPKLPPLNLSQHAGCRYTPVREYSYCEQCVLFGFSFIDAALLPFNDHA